MAILFMASIGLIKSIVIFIFVIIYKLYLLTYSENYSTFKCDKYTYKELNCLMHIVSRITKGTTYNTKTFIWLVVSKYNNKLILKVFETN